MEAHMKPLTLLLGVGLTFGYVGLLYAASSPALNTAKIEQLTGAKGKMEDKDKVFKVSAPRDDLQVTIAGVTATPPMGLTSWAAFKKVRGSTLVMGDMVVLEDQVNPVMSAALESGLNVTALHNHFFWDSPKVMFMHIGGMGDEDKLAQAVGKLFSTIKETGSKPSGPSENLDPKDTSLDPKIIDGILGKSGEMNKGVYKVTFAKPTRMKGQEIGAAMGVNTWAAFVGSDEKAVVDGDFAMYEHELQGVLKALRSAGIYIVAIHNHMAGEKPRVVFLHYWGVGSTKNLAEGLQAALSTQKR